MNRRSFAKALGASACGLAGLPGVRRRDALPAALADLYDEQFVAALPQTSLEVIATRLVARGVLVGATPRPFRSWRSWHLCIARVGVNAADDALIEFNRSLYTETELLLYSFAARLRSEAASGQHPLPRGELRQLPVPEPLYGEDLRPPLA